MLPLGVNALGGMAGGGDSSLPILMVGRVAGGNDTTGRGQTVTVTGGVQAGDLVLFSRTGSSANTISVYPNVSGKTLTQVGRVVNDIIAYTVLTQADVNAIAAAMGNSTSLAVTYTQSIASDCNEMLMVFRNCVKQPVPVSGPFVSSVIPNPSGAAVYLSTTSWTKIADFSHVTYTPTKKAKVVAFFHQLASGSSIDWFSPLQVQTSTISATAFATGAFSTGAGDDQGGVSYLADIEAGVSVGEMFVRQTVTQSAFVQAFLPAGQLVVLE